MKKLSIILTSLAFIFLGLTSASAEENAFKTAQERIATEPALEGRIVEVGVNGMVCDFCAQSLIKVLEKKEAVERVDISLEHSLLIITEKEGMAITDKEVDEAVVWAGYEISGIKRA